MYVNVDHRTLNEDEIGGVVRKEWLFEASGLCQQMMGEVLSAQPRMAARIARISRDLPPPTSKLEALALQGLLFDVILAMDRTEQTRNGRIAAAISRALREVHPDVRTRHFAREAAGWIEERMLAALDVKAIARRVGCDETALRRLFRAEYGIPMREYHTRLRVRQAIRIMPAHDNVGDVARAVGYNSEKNFYRAVRQVTGATPAALKRRSHKALMALAASIVPKGRTSAADGVTALPSPALAPTDTDERLKLAS